MNMEELNIEELKEEISSLEKRFSDYDTQFQNLNTKLQKLTPNNSNSKNTIHIVNKEKSNEISKTRRDRNNKKEQLISISKQIISKLNLLNSYNIEKEENDTIIKSYEQILQELSPNSKGGKRRRKTKKSKKRNPRKSKKNLFKIFSGY